MVDETLSNDSSLPLSALQRIDLVCQDFEAAWKAGTGPQIEVFLGDATGQQRAQLLKELLLLELDYRRRNAESPDITEYQRRFPQDGQLLDTVFAHCADRAATSPPPGTRIKYFGDYELLEEIGSGGMGVVYKARQISLNRIVAVKMILRGQLVTDVEVRRFRAEAETLAELQHPNIVAIHEVGEHGGQHYYAMDYIQGQNLGEVVRDGPLPARTAATYALKIAETIQFAHDKNILHRDLKPANVLIDESGEPHLSDFGLAKNMQVGSDLTTTGRPLGTPSYMSPEQADGNLHALGRATDVYGLGAVLYDLITGQPPFRAANVIDTMTLVREREPIGPRTLNRLIPLDLETICLKALEKTPSRRYQTARDFADEMRRFLEGKPIQARPVSTWNRGWRWAKRNPANASLIASVVLVLLVGITATSYSLLVARNNYRLAVASLVDALATAAPAQVPQAIAALEPFGRTAIPVLRRRYTETSIQRKLRAAYGLAEFGEVETSYLINSVEGAAQGECDNLVEALSHQRDVALVRLKEAAATATSDEAWELKTRLATIALYLSDTTLAAEMLRGEPTPGDSVFDPVQRTMFIEFFPKWAGSVAKLANLLCATGDAPLRSGMVLAMGSMSAPTAEAKRIWEPVLAKWHMEDTDTGLHSASGWALRSWGLAVPAVQAGQREGFDWYVTKMGLTMIRIPAGRVERPAGQVKLPQGFSHYGEERRIIRIVQDFWLCDREVSEELFVKFLDHTEYSLSTPVHNRMWTYTVRQIASREGGSPWLPVRHVSWYDALNFCNWLSRQDGREPCYRKAGKEDIREPDGEVLTYDSWELIPDANGYRLPTDDQWEYACRAWTTTTFSFGNEQGLLHSYAVFLKNASQEGPDLAASRLCNLWGLFDMHGNVYEWCERLHPMSVPTRGGSWRVPQSMCKSARQLRFNSNYHDEDQGFRVAIVPSGK